MSNSSNQEPNSDYETISLPFNMGNRELFPDGKFQVFKHKSEHKSLAKVFFDQKFHGPPHSVHGGAQAYILDEVMGCTGWMHGFSVVAKKINVEFLKPVPVLEDLTAFGVITSQQGPYVSIEAKLCDQNGTVLSRSSGTFRVLTQDKIGQFVP